MHRYRTSTCGALREGDIGIEARLSGWCHRIRDHGGVLFIDLRDHYGLTQVVADPDSPAFKVAETLRAEWVVRVDGKVRRRPGGTENPDLPTGAVEVYISEIEVLGPAADLPMPVFGDRIPEETRLKYRFLDLRRDRLHHNIMTRGAVINSIRRRMKEQGFFEFQTPILTASSPEGARDYLVPSRISSGRVLRVAAGAAAIQAADHGVRLRPLLPDCAVLPRRGCARRPFTRRLYQLDLEMSFVTHQDVFDAVEPVMRGVFEEFANGKPVTAKFSTHSLREAIAKYGTDKPDLRNPIVMPEACRRFSAGFRASRLSRAFRRQHQRRGMGHSSADRRLARVLRPHEFLGARRRASRALAISSLRSTTAQLGPRPGRHHLGPERTEALRVSFVKDGECSFVAGEPQNFLDSLGWRAPRPVRAREPSTCGLLDGPDARRLLGTEAGAAYVARTMRVRLTRTGHTVHGLLDVGTTPVSAIMRPPVFCGADVSVREAARRLGEPGTSALLVRLAGDELAIVTDAELRAVAADGASLDAPVSAIARTPVPTAPVGQLAIEATVDMLAAGVEHLAVVDGAPVCGILGASDLLGLDAHSPIALRHTILGAADEEVLVRATSHQPQLFVALVRAGVPPRDLGRVLSLQHDAVVSRLIDFSISAHGPAPVPWAWLDLGSAARREFTLASDQDNALAYGPPAAGAESHVDDYFARLGADVNDGLARCGIGVDDNGVLARNPLWRMSRSDWLRTFDECLQVPDESHLIRASVAFDFRTAGGALAITAALSERIRAARQHPEFMRLVARTASGYPVALGFRGQLAVHSEGDAPKRLDLKRGAIIPLVNLVRYHALAHGVTISPTIDRIEAVASVGGLDRELADALLEAFAVISRVRFQHHAALIAEGEPLDNLLDPGELTPIVRGELREALHVVRRAQRRIGP